MKINTCTGNEMYGHAQILRAYCGVDIPAVIRGRIQHGWSVGHGASIPVDSLTEAGEPIFVWTERDKCSLPNVQHVIGAPFLYLPEPPRTGGRGTLGIPGHSIENKKIPLEAWWDYADWLRVQDSTARVLLHARDWRNEVLVIFESKDIKTSMCGSLSSPSFLPNFVDVALSAERVLVNSVSTSLFYALYLGLPVMVAGPPTKTVPGDWYDTEASDPDWVNEHFPMLLQLSQDRNLAVEQLGAKHKQSPAALFETLFGWQWH